MQRVPMPSKSFQMPGLDSAQRDLRLAAFALFAAGMLLRTFADAIHDARRVGAFRQRCLQLGDADLEPLAIPAAEGSAASLSQADRCRGQNPRP